MNKSCCSFLSWHRVTVLQLFVIPSGHTGKADQIKLGRHLAEYTVRGKGEVVKGLK